MPGLEKARQAVMPGSETVPQCQFEAYRSFVMSEESLLFVILRSGSDEESPARKREILRCAQDDNGGRNDPEYPSNIVTQSLWESGSGTESKS